MTTITLPDDLDAPLSEQANRNGITPALLAEKILREKLVPTTPTQNGVEGSGSLYDLLKDVIGSVHSGGKETLSIDCGEKFTEILLEKKRQGKL